MLATRTTAGRLAVLAMATLVANACTDSAADPLKLAPQAPLAAKSKTGLTHPVGVLSQTVPLPGTWGIAVSSTGEVLASQPTANTIGGFSLSDPTTLRQTLPVDGWPLDIIVNAKGTVAYVSSGNTGNIDVIDIKSNTKTDTIPLVQDIYRLRLAKNEAKIYATTLGGELWAAPLKGGKKQKASINFGTGSAVNGASLSPSYTDLYAASTNGTIWRLDPETLAIRAQVSLPYTIQDIAVTPDGTALWAAGENGYVLRLDPMTLAVNATIWTGQYGYAGPFGLAISPDGARVYAAASQSGTIYIISEPTPNTFDVASIVVGGDPRRIAFSADGSTAVVSNYYTGVHIIQ